MTSLTALPLVARLSERVIRILACNPGFMTLQGTNTYLVGTGTRRVLIDTGDGKQQQYIQLLGDVLVKEKAVIEHICITHYHEDHIGGTAAVLSLIEQQLGSNTPVIWKGRRHRTEVMSPTERSIMSRPYTRFSNITIEGATLTSMHTPGHTSDHYSIKLLEEGALFSGDCVLGEGTTVFENLPKYMQSLQKLLDLKPKVIYPGHGPMVLNTIEHIQMYIKHRESRDMDIIYLLDQMGRPMGEDDITRRIYKDLPEQLWPHALSNVTQHLHKLQKEGRIEGGPGDWYTMVFYG